MIVLNRKFAVVMGLIWSAGVMSVPSFAQEILISKTDLAKENPFDFALDLVAPQTSEIAPQTSGIALRSKVSTLAVAPQLQYRNELVGDVDQGKQLLNSLTVKYGPPTSQRDDNYVWELDNPDKGGLQAKNVTIILHYKPGGASELIMDRAKGENGQETWDIPRRVLAPVASSTIQKSRQVQGKVQVNEN